MPQSSFAIVVVAALLSGCAMQGSSAVNPSPVPVASAEPIQRAAETTFTTVDASFSIVSTSEVGAELALPTMRAATGAFTSMFGEQPAAIAVVVIDSTVPGKAVMRGAAQAGGLVITLIGSGLAEDSTGVAGIRSSFEKTLSVLSAEAWVGAYANAWTEALVQGEIVVPRSTDSTDVPQLPDWLYAGTIHLLANDFAVPQASMAVRVHSAQLMPLADLFAFKVPVTSDADLEEFLSGLSAGAMSRAQFRAEMSPPRRQTAVFLAQATSVLEYLREVRGVDVGRDLIGPMLAGFDMPSVVHATLRISMAELERDWRRWALVPSGGDL